MKTVCVTGHRPKGFPWRYNNEHEIAHWVYVKKLKETVLALVSMGCSHFISGGALGVDLDFAKTVLDIRENFDVTIEIAVPCPNQDLKWREKDKKLYSTILQKANSITVISDSHTRNCFQRRNEYMVNNSDFVLAVWNGEKSGGTYNTICYAQKISKEIQFLLLQDCMR